MEVQQHVHKNATTPALHLGLAVLRTSLAVVTSYLSLLYVKYLLMNQ